ncbi:protein RRNAD1-like isoform X1 [Pseudomyrmex gracilis]|uniref:protein RRNAD1-like isoform X1 n=1 Tax=Pseudomyrmex gracilis TaxID=219809 RepID=UPI000994DF5C|nr:protein RRNAD1-like isoform X1 [Pseudomyrmex gracilis]
MAAPTVTCTCGACSRSRATIQQIFHILDTYGWLLDSYVVDFFQEQLWEKLPSNWKIVLRTVSPEEFGVWLAGDISRTRVWPLSLLALRRITKDLQLKRDHRDNGSIVKCEKTNNKFEFNSNLIPENKDTTLCDKQVVLKKHNLFLKHVKIKKRHEIQQIAEICADCAKESNAKCIVDVGAGMGHLARTLAFKYNLRVICIEQDSSLSKQARKWDKELFLSLSKHLPDLSLNFPQHVSVRIENTDSNQTEIIKNIQEIFSDNFNLDEKSSGFGIVGLHPCGDLAATLLKLYASRDEAKFICIVGCCYMKLTLEHSINVLNGHPLSEYLSSSSGNRKMSYTALEVACHAIEIYCDKLKTGNYEDLIVHAYRAALETILTKRSEKLRRNQVKNVKVTNSMTFEQYCTAATADFEPHFRPTRSDCQDPQIQSYLNQWQQIVIFGALRTMLAPLVETVVLLDRFLYLSENNLSPILKPIFDARLSPRNFLLFSVKRNE